MPDVNSNGELVVLSDLTEPLHTHGVTAYINAGGRGTRLGTLFPSHPEIGISKALLSLQPEASESNTLIDYHINRFQVQGFTNIVIGVGDHLPVAAHIEQTYGQNSGVKAVVNERQAGTAGDLYHALITNPYLFASKIIIQNCDTLLDVHEPSLIMFHEESHALLSIVTTSQQVTSNNGAFLVDSKRKVVYNREVHIDCSDISVAEDQLHTRASSCGMLVINKEVVLEAGEKFVEGNSYSLYKDVMRFCLESDGVFAYDNFSGYFCDIGTPEDYIKASENPKILEYLLSRCLNYQKVA